MYASTFCYRAQFVIENSGSLKDTEDAVRSVHASLSSSRFHWRIRLAMATAIGGVVALVCLAVKATKSRTSIRTEF